MSGLVIVDRDGVLNAMVVNPDHGTVDSPLHPSQVVLLPRAPDAVRRLNEAGYAVAIATNQPAAAKGKTTRANLEAVHATVLAAVADAGGHIASSHICWHTQQDGCRCRKPQPGLLLDALAGNGHISRNSAWMVGDGLTDVQAGAALGLRTAFLAPRSCSSCRLLDAAAMRPDYWGDSLYDFVDAFLRGHIEWT